MAGQVLCDLCQAEPAEIMQSNLLNGDTVAIGPSCAPAFYATVLETILAGMPAEIASEYAPLAKQVLDAAVRISDPAPAKPARGRKSKPATAPPDETGEGSDDNGETQPQSVPAE